MPGLPHALWPSLIGLLLIAMVVRRSLMTRKLRLDRMLIFPGAILLITLAMLAQDPPREPLTIEILVAAALLGAAVGWHRGKLTRITYDAVDGTFTAQPSIAAVVLILAVFAVRYGLRFWLAATPGGGHSHEAVLATNALMMSAVGMWVVQRAEMFLRCRKLLAEAAPAA